MPENESSARIVVIDDNVPMMNAVVRLLQRAGYAVWGGISGADCLRLVREHQPLLVLLDVALPDINGLEVGRQIKADPALRGSFVVLFSASHITSAEQSSGLESGADGYIARPIENRELLARVQAYIRIKRVEEERNRLIEELQEALAQVKALSGLLPICASCKKIRDDQGYWQQIEVYIRDHSEAEFSHSLCPECLHKLYPDWVDEADKPG